MHVCEHSSAGAYRSQRTLELEVEVTVSHRMQVLETQLRSPGRHCVLLSILIFSPSDKHILRHAQILNDEHFLNE